MKTVIIIPARYASSRLPGKPLIEISGKTMIKRTWERCVLAMPDEQIYVATDDDRIASHCRNFGIQVVMTSNRCLTGTDRVFEASQQIKADTYINVQGDEPAMNPEDILAVMSAAQNYPKDIINGMCPITTESEFRSAMIPKVVARPDGRLLYMSRAPIPTTKDHLFKGAMRQVCVMAYPSKMLAEFAAVKEKTPLEAKEDIELLRFMELGHDIRMIELSEASIAVDTPDDVVRAERVLAALGIE
jgi:3-deoxy-manno-octulosonate cytidylyltransferase (CMP-KDO synthetase)